MSTRQQSAFEDLTELSTTNSFDITHQITSGSSVTSPKSRGLGFYFECTVLVVAFSAFCLQCFEAVGWAAGRTSGL